MTKKGIRIKMHILDLLKILNNSAMTAYIYSLLNFGVKILVMYDIYCT